MKKSIYLITSSLVVAAVLSLSSCLKDPRLIDLTKGGTVVDFPKGGLNNFGGSAITDAGDTIVKQFAVNVASPNPTTSATNITIAVDNTITDNYNTSQSAVFYEHMPTNAFALSATDLTVPAGQRYATVSVTFYKSMLDPSKSYMLPIKISKTSNGIISGNYGILYYHFIGNDFAGTYDLIWTRWNVADTSGAPAYDHLDLGTEIASPVDPTTFKIGSGYYTGIPYTVTFTKTGTGSSATYSNFAVTFTADDIDAYFTQPSGGSVVLAAAPTFDPAPDPNKQYTYAEALKLFRFYYTTGSRAIIDQFIRQ